MDINAYLDAAKSELGCETDASLAARFGVVHSRISHYRNGKALPNLQLARRIARALKLRPAKVIDDIRRERARRRR
ncbi:MAG TPA: helix-turn-helix transcriptional regulator [Burkholderiales bacterium]|nr:helix-turn-helix transcriptional regulator [Burkholderiales bacterium]